MEPALMIEAPSVSVAESLTLIAPELMSVLQPDGSSVCVLWRPRFALRVGRERKSGMTWVREAVKNIEMQCQKRASSESYFRDDVRRATTGLGLTQ
jgi:hypothetical protein